MAECGEECEGDSAITAETWCDSMTGENARCLLSLISKGSAFAAQSRHLLPAVPSGQQALPGASSVAQQPSNLRIKDCKPRLMAFE